MPSINPIKHNEVIDTALPYIPNASVVSTGKYYRAGSNVLTTIKGVAERRPGFVVSTTNTGMTAIERRFLWRRWAGSFFEMLNVVTGSQSIIYKREIGTDLTFGSAIFTSSVAEPFDFAVANNHVFFCNGTDMKKYDGTTVTNWGITAPTSAVSISLGAGALTATIGYQYVIAWENQTTGHISSPSPISATTVPATQNVTITGNTTSDSQVTHVRIYRTADGGSIFFEHPSSPITYATWTSSGLTDSAADTTLKSTVAPLQNQNNRPTASKGVVWYAGRLWTVAGDLLYHSGWEEIAVDTSDAPEECFPIDNFFPFGEELEGLGTTAEALIIFGSNTVFKITGDTLDTFRRDILARRRGTRNRATITSNGKICAWLDSSNTVQITDSYKVEELSLPIRPDLATITHVSAAMTFHDDGIRHWLVLMDGGADCLRVYDQDKEHWMVPWTLGGITAIHSGETAAGEVKLLLGRNGKPIEMAPTTYSDEGTAFTSSLTLGLTHIAEDIGPDSRGYVDYVSIERNARPLSDVSLCIDDDPATATFTSLFANEREPPYRTNGAALLEKQYPTERGPVGRRVSAKFDWPAQTTNFALYSFDIAYHER